MHEESGEYTSMDAAAHFARYLLGQSTDNLLELSFQDRKRIHNLKYYTWIEQQGRELDELNAQWQDENYWTEVQKQIPEIDALITDFNQQVGLIK